MELRNVRFSKGEELANAISHLVGAILGAVGLVLMIAYSVREGSGWHLAASIVYGSALVVLYLSSMFNHWLPEGRAKEFFFNFDQIAIYILIAGTYTPLALIALHGTLGWIIFGVEWGFALIGILIKIFRPTRFNQGVSLFFIVAYIVMGSVIFIPTKQVIDAVSLSGFFWVVLGGVFYIGGTIFYKIKNIKFIHLAWHLCVIAGSAAHFVGVYFYVLPLSV